MATARPLLSALAKFLTPGEWVCMTTGQGSGPGMDVVSVVKSAWEEFPLSLQQVATVLKGEGISNYSTHIDNLKKIRQWRLFDLEGGEVEVYYHKVRKAWWLAICPAGVTPKDEKATPTGKPAGVRKKALPSFKLAIGKIVKDRAPGGGRGGGGGGGGDGELSPSVHMPSRTPTPFAPPPGLQTGRPRRSRTRRRPLALRAVRGRPAQCSTVAATAAAVVSGFLSLMPYYHSDLISPRTQVDSRPRRSPQYKTPGMAMPL